MGPGTVLASTVGLAVVGISSWLLAAEYPGVIPQGDFEPRRLESWQYSGPDAAARRRATLARAGFRLDPHEADELAGYSVPPAGDPLDTPVPACRFVSAPPSGTSAKFDCVFDGGDLVKVKYGRNPEIHAEAAATRLLKLLDYPTDNVTIVPRLRCYGCPRLPFVAMHLQEMFGLPLVPAGGHDDSYTDFEWVGVERRFPARPIVIDTQEGWSWWELRSSAAPRAEVDALRLLAVFLAHWDNKSENQRLVCLDAGADAAPDAGCARPLAMIQDLGATFGPSKVNLVRWNDLPIWQDRQACTVSMRALPFGGASFGEEQISEQGRRHLAGRLAAISDTEVERLFAEARFPQFQVGTDDAGDLKAWTGAFRNRVDQIAKAGPCP